MPNFDVAVCGVGAMGSAALYSLARRGLRVVGIERVRPGHDGGSSHGLTRMFRLSYFEHPSYVPLLRCALALWRELEQAAGLPLMHRTGILEIGSHDGMLVPSTLAAARLHDLAHEVFEAQALMRAYPMFHVPDHFVAVHQPDGGFIESAAALQGLNMLARRHGATLRNGERVTRIVPRRGGVSVVTDQGRINVGKAIVSAGAWAATLLPELSLPLRTTRQVLAWFEPLHAAPFTEDRCPVFLMESRTGLHYGIPFAGEPGLKLAKHHHEDETVNPDTVGQAVSPRDIDLIRGAVRDLLPVADGPLIASKTCLYTMTPDHDFIIDRHPDCADIIVASPCSGHGFKFTPVIGEILADLATTGVTPHNVSRFRIDRFTGASAPS